MTASSEFSLKGRVALITGGGRDIGKAIALSMGRAGADVVISYLSSHKSALATVHELHALDVRGAAISGDARDAQAVSDLAAQAEEFGGGRVDIVVNNVGGNIRVARLHEIDEALVTETFALNFTSALLLSQALIPPMVERGFGRVINIGSIAAATGGGPAEHHYAAAKAAVTSLGRTLSNEFGKGSGVTFNTIAPGFVDNAFHTKTPRAVVERLTDMIPLGRVGANEDIGGAAVFLASEAASWITGEVVNVNGGLYYGR